MNRLKVTFFLVVLALTTLFFLLNGCASNSSTGNSPSDSDPDPIPPLDPSISIFINQVETDCSSGVPEVSAYVTVIDEQGDQIDGLDLTHFEITENSDPISPDSIDFFDIEDQLSAPISVSIIMDYSGSVIEDETTKTNMENAVIYFIDLMKPNDQAEIIKFNNGIRYIQPLTSDKDLLRAAVTGQEVETGQTYLYDTLYTGIEDLAGITGRKAVVAITDGEENHNENYIGDERSQQDVIALSRANDVPIFILGLGSEISVDTLLEITEETSGHFYQAVGSDDLTDIYTKVSNLLNNGQYLFIFDGTPDAPQTSNSLSISVSHENLTDNAAVTFSYSEDCL